jgi:hypothetical protein
MECRYSRFCFHALISVFQIRTLLLLLSCITIPAAFLFLLFILIFQLNVQVYLGALSARRYSAVTLLSVVMELSVAAVIVIFIIYGAK